MTGVLATVETVSQHVLRQIAANEDQTTDPGLVRLPGALMVAFEQHVNALNDEAIRIVFELRTSRVLAWTSGMLSSIAWVATKETLAVRCDGLPGELNAVSTR